MQQHGRRRAAVLFASLAILVAVPALAQEPVTTVILVRHAEKVAGSGDPVLAATGEARARELARVLGDVRLDAVYSTPFIRTRETARPVAERHGLSVTEVRPDEMLGRGLAERILREHDGGTVLVVGHSNTTPAIASALGAHDPPAIADHEYDHLFVVTIAGGRAKLAVLRYGAQTP